MFADWLGTVPFERVCSGWGREMGWGCWGDVYLLLVLLYEGFAKEC